MSQERFKMEKWKDIEDYEGRYQISNLGRVKSLKRKTFRYIRESSIIMKPLKGDGRYFQISLWKNGKDKKMYIHRLVGIYFIPNPDNKPQVNHTDGNRLNNHVKNLEWSTGSENIKHAFDTGLITEEHIRNMSLKSSKISRKFSDHDIYQIFALYKKGFSKAHIARTYNAGETTIRNILSKITYKHVEANL